MRTLDEHAERVRLVREHNPFPSMTMGSSWSVSTDEVFEAYEAERAARLTAEARVRELEVRYETSHSARRCTPKNRCAVSRRSGTKGGAE